MNHLQQQMKVILRLQQLIKLTHPMLTPPAVNLSVIELPVAVEPLVAMEPLVVVELPMAVESLVAMEQCMVVGPLVVVEQAEVVEPVI